MVKTRQQIAAMEKVGDYMAQEPSLEYSQATGELGSPSSKHLSAKRSHHSSSSSTKTVQKLAVIAEHARKQANLEAERERVAAERERVTAERERVAAERERAVAELELQAQLAAIENASASGSRHSHSIVDLWLDKNNVLGVPQNLVIDSTQKVVPMQPTEALGSVQPPTVARPVCLCATASTKVSHMQLPNFDGKSNDWLIFRRIYEDTKPVFSPAENLIRLSGALRGAAKEAVTTLLIAANDPDQVIEALQRRFGQSEVIVIQEVAKIKALPKINLSDSGKQVSDFACKVRNCVETIKLLKQREYLFSPELCNAIIGKLPVSMQVQWAHFAFKMNNENFSKLELLSDFLDHEANIRNRFGYITTSDISNVNTNIKGSKFNYYSTSFQNVDAQLNKKFTYKVNDIFCYFCKSSQHNTTDCQEFLNLSVEDRWLWVKEKKVCYHCLKKGGHKYISCKPTQRCGVQGCMKKHHELLHIISPPTCNENTNNSDVVTHSSTLSPPSAFPKPLLKIIGVTLSGPLGKIDTFALLDDGSTGTFIDADIAKIIGASGPSTLLQMKCISGLSKEAQVQVVDFDIKGQNSNVTYHVRNARSIKDLNLGAQRSLIIDDLKLYSHLADLTDKVSYYENAKPMLLLGIDNWHLIISKETRRGRKSEPVASLTALGWVLFGFRNSRTDSVEFVNQCTSERSNDLDIIIQDYYNLDSIGITKKDLYSADDKRAIRILDDTIRHLPNGRFEVGLLWRNDNMDIPNSSYNLALNRFKSLENKFMKDTSYAELYRRNIQATIDKGYVEPCLSEPTSSSFTWYLPHFGVMNQNKPGKLRVVHDAAANCEGISLNSLLLPGPVLLQSLFDILLRFREGKIALSADIREMFPQIKIRAEDRDAQRFLWRQSVDAPITSFRMSSMIFGAASSPFTALYVKNKNALEYKTEYPNAVDAIIKNHYMDDYLGSLDDINSAAEIARDIIFIHKQACFEMRSWVTNFPEVLKFVPPDFQLNNGCDINLGNFPQSVRTLGLIWHHNTDCIGFNINKSNKISYTFTKRNVLSQLMRIFDPLGLLTPLTIKGRILFQRAWRKGLYWDQELSSDDQIKWKHWFSDVEAVQFLKIPRWYITNEDSSIINNENVVDRELHVFSDASQSAYAAVAYWRFVFRDQSIRTSLICSRARVSPLKPISIPRLELQGALIAARLAATICLAVVHKPTKRFFWCDSKNVLAWLRNDACNFKPFIAHRVGEILEITARKEWRWVPTKFNVADDATRFQSTRLSLIDRWFSGPKFLFLETNVWPAETDTHLIPIIELKKSAKLVDVNLINETITKNPVVADPVRFSSWLRFLRTTAYVHKYVKRLKLLVIKKKGLTLTSQPCNGSGRDTPALVDLTAEDLMSARLQVLRSCQADSFNRELRCLQTGTPLPQDNKLRNLEISLAEDGLMRLSGRIEASTFQTEDLNKPIILDGDHRIVHLLILHYHIKFAHANNETILNEMRQQFFIFRLRSIIKKVCHSCQFCKNRKATVCCPSFGNLPAARLAHHYRPFTFTGLDYFGPVIVCVGRRTEKRYVALFTCLSTRAIHLEVVNSLSADSAILALRRFIARRGTPQEIWSDNGTSFVGANKELKAFYGDAISNTAANLNIHWHFIPPASPFMGGAWERLVRSVKQALKVTLLQKHPQEQILWTLLTEAENIVNSRPLTYIPTDATEEALTPNHFLLGTSSGAQIRVSLTDRDLCGRSDWKKAIRLSDHFWRRWIKEYLPTLVPRRSASTDHRNLSVGDIVVIVDANLPRGSWPKGRISAVFPGKDGSVRIADVTTEAGTLRRPAKKIIRLPI